MPSESGEVRLVAMSETMRDHIRRMSEMAWRLSIDSRTKDPKKFKADSEAAVALADAYDAGITKDDLNEAGRIVGRESECGYFPCTCGLCALDRKLRSAFPDTP